MEGLARDGRGDPIRGLAASPDQKTQASCRIKASQEWDTEGPHYATQPRRCRKVVVLGLRLPGRSSEGRPRAQCRKHRFWRGAEPGLNSSLSTSSLSLWARIYISECFLFYNRDSRERSVQGPTRQRACTGVRAAGPGGKK